MARGKKEVKVADSPREIPGYQMTCRVQHDWPYNRLQDGKVPPRGVWMVLVDSSLDLWKMFDRCPRDGKIRWRYMPHRMWSRFERWHYINPKEWVKMRERFTKADAQLENFNRNASRIPTLEEAGP